MVTRKLMPAILALGLSVGLLAEQGAGAEGTVLQRAPAKAEPTVDPALFRSDIDGYVRELNEQLRTMLNENLRRELQAPKIVLAADERRARG
jgi:hypothetical protein